MLLLDIMQKKIKRYFLVVPTTSLVEQMYQRFSRIMDGTQENYCHRIYAGKEKTNENPVTITTWQSIYKLKKTILQRL